MKNKTVLTTIISIALAAMPFMCESLTKIKNYGSLKITWAGVLDNKESSSWPHGPLGNLHVITYHADSECPGDRSEYTEGYTHTILRGPSDKEWNDGDEKFYEKGHEIFTWTKKSEAIKVFIYESDPNFILPFRKHDSLLCKTIYRDETLDGLVESGNYCTLDVIEKYRSEGFPDWLSREKVWYKDVDVYAPSIFVKFKTKEDYLVKK